MILTSVKTRIAQGPHVTDACIVLFLFLSNTKHVFPFPCRCTFGTWYICIMGYKATSMHCVLRCLCFMLLHLFSAAQDDDIRSKNASVFIVSHFVLLIVHPLQIAKCIKLAKVVSCTVNALYFKYSTKLDGICLN